MQAHPDALPLALVRTADPRSRQAVVRLVQDRCDVAEFDKPEIGRDASPHFDHRATVAMASVWLAFYVIAAIPHFMTAGN
jgi:hypothetical protein